MQNEYRYVTTARFTTARRGVVAGAGGAQELEFSSPPEFQGESGFWTPEQMLVGAAAACFVATFRAIAEFSKFEFLSLEVATEGVLSKGEGGYRFTQVFVRPVLTIARESDRERALRLLEKAERGCLISRSLQAQISLEPAIKVTAAAQV